MRTFVQAGAGAHIRKCRRLGLVLAACAVAVAVFCATALGAASPSGIALDPQSGRATVAGALRALAGDDGTRATPHSTLGVSTPAVAAAGVPTISAPPD